MIAATKLVQESPPGSPIADSFACHSPVLFVDLDGTLISSDLLWESLLLALRREPGVLPKIPGWLRQGRATLKEKLIDDEMPVVALLPYREEVVAFLRAERSRGVRIVLATASHRKLADEVARHLNLFDGVLATDSGRNLKGPAKLDAIRQYCQEHRYGSFAYLGDSAADLTIWNEAEEILVVDARKNLLPSIRRLGKRAHVLTRSKSTCRAMLRAVRPHQWAKNVLLFAPLVLAHEFRLGTILNTLIAFIAFSFCASAVYVINDLVDMESDRRHPRKRHRPFASGALSIPCGVALSSSLLVAGMGLAAVCLPLAFVEMLGCYLILTTSYSLWLKRKLLIDVFLLAGLYTLRIVAGGLATGTPVSEWLMAFSIFLFTSLAFAKRYSELVRLSDEGRDAPCGRGYRVADLSMIESIGPASGYLAVLVLAMYINSDAMKNYYAQPWALWMVCPVLLYWITRLWFVAKRRKLSEDPVIYAMKDNVSRLVGGVAAALVTIAAIRW